MSSLTPEKIDQEWQQSQSRCEALIKDGAQSYFGRESTTQQVKEAFFEGERVVYCIDERVSGPLHAAGSLVLLPLQDARDLVAEMHVQGITSHSDCGAMAIAYRSQHELADGTPVESIILNQFAQDRALELADELNVEYRGHVGADQMKGPQGLHIARAIYYHDTPFANLHKVPALPPGFVVSRVILNEEQAISDVELSIAIAFGGHGFAERFTAENPLLLIVIAEEGKTQALVDELQELAVTYQNRITVDCITVKND